MRRIQIYDTTLRDGSQGEGVNFSLQDKLLITERLDELGVDLHRGRLPALATRRTPSTSSAVRELKLAARQGRAPSA